MSSGYEEEKKGDDETDVFEVVGRRLNKTEAQWEEARQWAEELGALLPRPITEAVARAVYKSIDDAAAITARNRARAEQLGMSGWGKKKGGMYSPLAKKMMKKQTMEGTVKERMGEVMADLMRQHAELQHEANTTHNRARYNELMEEMDDLRTQMREGVKGANEAREEASEEFANEAETLERKEAASKQGKGRSGKLKLLELFKGTGSIGKAAHKLGWEVVSVDLDPIYTPDIETDILKWDYKKWAKDHNYTPDLIWASPPCNTFSPLAYPLKERNTKTATPYSARAKQGTAILHRTIDIISYFKKKNPHLLFVMENPRGMMRNDPEVQKMPHRDTTLYCLYNDVRYKPTDFFNNVGKDGLHLKPPVRGKCKDTIGVVDLPLDKRYAIPQKLARAILVKMADTYKSGGMKGGSMSAQDARTKYPQRSYESDADYQKRIDRVVAQEKRFEEQGITPDMRQTAIVSASDARQLEAIREVLGQEATKQAWENDPDTIAKKKAIADREASDSFFNPILRGLVGIEKFGSQFLPGALGTVAGMNADYLTSSMDAQEAKKQARIQAHADKEASLQGYHADRAQQLENARAALGLAPGEPVDFQRLDALIAEKKKAAATGEVNRWKPVVGSGYFSSSSFM